MLLGVNNLLESSVDNPFMGHLRDYTSEGFCIKLNPSIIVVIYLFMHTTLPLFTAQDIKAERPKLLLFLAFAPYVLEVITGMLLLGRDSVISKPSISGQSRLQIKQASPLCSCI